jgi:hypothetical protein
MVRGLKGWSWGTVSARHSQVVVRGVWSRFVWRSMVEEGYWKAVMLQVLGRLLAGRRVVGTIGPHMYM